MSSNRLSGLALVVSAIVIFSGFSEQAFAARGGFRAPIRITPRPMLKRDFNFAARPGVSSGKSAAPAARAETRNNAQKGAGKAAAKSNSNVTRQDTFNSKSGGFGDKRYYERHYRDHGKDFGATSAADYVNKARAFYTQRHLYLRKLDSRGTLRVYDPKSNTFASYNKNETTKTFYKPDPAKHKFASNMDYWNAQQGVPQ